MLVQGCNNASRGVDTQALPERPVEELKYTVHLPRWTQQDAEDNKELGFPPHPTPPNINICVNPRFSAANAVRQLPPETKRLPLPLCESFI
jgi:hypothetical protein